MDAYKYLNDIEKLDKMIAGYMTEIEKCNELVKKISCGKINETFEKNIMKKQNAAFTNIIYNLIDYKEKLSEAIEELKKRKAFVIDIIKDMDIEDALILQYKYILLKSFEEIADIMGRTPKTVYRKHSLAVNRFKQLYIKTKEQ